MTTGKTSRTSAVAILDAVLGEGKTLVEALEAVGQLRALPAQDRARAQRLAVDVIRHLEPIERVLAPRLRKSPPLHVMNILRLAAYERSLGEAAHGVVNAAVDMARAGKRSQHLAGMVNAVLRALPDPLELTGPPQMMPRWLRQPLVHAYGRDVVAAIESVHASAPPIDLTLRAGAAVAVGHGLPTGSQRLRDGGQISAIEGYEKGAFWVQDAAAALAVPLLGDVTGARVLDICAAPGGKTMQLADRGAIVTALDISGPRMDRLRQNLARTGLAADCVVQDALTYRSETMFDAILLDAPCSATGTIRRHPELPYLKDSSEIAGLVALQAQLIDHAVTLLAPKGRMVFATCSLLPGEGEDQLTALLDRHPDLTVLPPQLKGIDPEWITKAGALRLRPDYWADRGGMDGFFMVCVQKT
ncbi:MAG: transcription antitermination factor NusB [Cypionkella sp.]|nr:transcription antitermination factor NusB [Cypionkella sp.]